MIIYECLSRRCSDILCQGGRIHFTFFFRNHKYFDIFLHRKTDHIKQLEKNVNQSNFVIHEKSTIFTFLDYVAVDKPNEHSGKKMFDLFAFGFLRSYSFLCGNNRKYCVAYYLLWLYALFVFDDIFRSRSSMTKKEKFLSTSF